MTNRTLLRMIADVDLTGIEDGESLVWVAADQKFVAGAPAGGGGGDGAQIFVQNSAPSTSNPPGSLWIDADSENVDLYQLSDAETPAWVDTGINLRGIDGADPGYLFTFDDATTSSPGSGLLRADHASLASATTLYISKTSRGGSTVTDRLLELAIGSKTVPSTIILTDPATEAQASFLCGAVSDETGYVSVAVSGHAGATSFADGIALSLQRELSGDDGEDGADGGASSPAANVLINGEFAVNQRLISSATDDIYTLDRWYALTQTAAVGIAQQTLQENGTPYNIRLTQSQASAQRMGLAQIIVADAARPLRGKDVTLSARIRSSLSQAIRFAILEWTGTADAVTSDVVADWTSGTFTASNFFLSSNLTVTAVGTVTPSSNTWTDIDLGATLGSSAANLVVMFWTEGTFAQNATLDISRAKLEIGTEPTPFVYKSLTEILAVCEAYYWKSFGLGTAPAQNAGVGNSLVMPQIIAASSTQNGITMSFPVRMRVAPSVTLYNPSANNAQVRNTSVNADCSSSGTTAMEWGVAVHCVTASGSAVGNQQRVHLTADAEL